jgi:hypothetical protein
MTRKYNPGHYVAMMRGNDSHEAMAAANNGHIRGIEKRYTWRSLEPVRGCYDFTEIDRDLALCRNAGRQLVAYIEDKTFKTDAPSGWTPENPLPDYLSHLAAPNKQAGMTAIRWHDEVIDRQQALVSKLGYHFDAWPALEGIALEETAPGLDDAWLRAFAYTPEAYRDTYISHIEHAAWALPTSLFFWHMNFMPGSPDGSYLSEIVSATAHLGNLVMGGPDVLPDNSALLKRAYPLYAKHQHDVPMHVQVSPGSMKEPGLTAQAAFEFARDVLNVDWLFWYDFPYGTSFTYADALAVMAANPEIQ